MILGSHNSLTYLKPTSILGRIFKGIGRCQRVDYKKQYELGVRYFDLRVRFNKKGDIEVAHGLNSYKISDKELDSFVNWVGQTPDVYCRILLELRKKVDDEDLQKEHFEYLCDALEITYPGKFFEGRVVYSWEQVYDFSYKPLYIEKHASVCSPKIVDDWYPLWYAKTKNKKIRRLYGKEGIIVYMDFVDIE